MSSETEHVMFLLRWWQEFLGGILITLLGLYFKSKGKSTESVIIPISEDEIDHKMTICKQGVLLAIHEELDKRDEKLLKHIKDLIK